MSVECKKKKHRMEEKLYLRRNKSNTKKNKNLAPIQQPIDVLEVKKSILNCEVIPKSKEDLYI